MSSLRRALILMPVLTMLLAASSPSSACDRCLPSPSAQAHSTPAVGTVDLLRSLDTRAAAASSARPHLAFPARIGIARIEGGMITAIPPAEWTTWRAMREQMSPALGELSPVTAVVAQSITADAVSRTPHDAISNLRLAAAREQLDLLLLYEVSIQHSMQRTELTLLDATIVGAWVFPTHRSHAVAHVSATLIDVRSGLAYGSAIGNASDVCNATLLGSEERLHKQRSVVLRKAVDALIPEIKTVITRLARDPRQPYERAGDRPPSSPDPATARSRTVPAPSTSRTNSTTEDRTIPPPAESGQSFWGER